MKKLRSLVVVVDPTIERDFVVEKAKRIAKTSNASVHFFINCENTLNMSSFIYDIYGGVDAALIESQELLFRERYQNLLQDLVEEFVNENIEASCSFGEGHNLAEAIIGKVKELTPDLVIKSTHHHSIIKRTLLGNTDWQLIRKCPAALLLVKPEFWKPEGSIVAAIDPLHVKNDQVELDKHIVSSMMFLCQEFEFQPGIFHSYSVFVPVAFQAGGEIPHPSKEHLDLVRGEHVIAVNQLAVSFGIGEENIHIAEGNLIPSLIEYLKEIEANVLVIGALSKNIVERAVIGNTAEKILETCPCDVLVLKHNPI